jgi:phosphatidylserine/phosphatidylglycerophosphate/cardiolipin synthase-like enzyme
MTRKPATFTAPLLLCALVLLFPARVLSEPRATTRTASTAAATQPGLSIETYFSPRDEIGPMIVELIDGAQETLQIAAFTFSHRDITQAIIRAHERGVAVRFVMDYTQSRLTTCRAIDLIEAGIEVRTRRRRGFQHNKYIVVDRAIVLTGSFNFSASSPGRRNTENVLVIRHAPDIVAAFAGDHDRIMADTLVKEK